MSNLIPFELGLPIAGVNKSIADHILPVSFARVLDNWIIKEDGLATAKGWDEFISQVLTDGAASPTDLVVLGFAEYALNNGSIYLIVFTNKVVYRYEPSEELFLPISGVAPIDTTVDSDSASGGTTLNVASTTGYAVGDRIIINRGGAREEEGVIASISAGVSFTMSANLGFTHLGADADIVEKLEYQAKVDADSASGGTTLNVDYTTPFSVGEEIVIGLGTSRVEYMKIDSISAGVSLTVSRLPWDTGTGLHDTHLGVDADKVYRIANLNGTNAEDVSYAISNDLLYVTDFVNNVRYWGGTGFLENLPGLETGDSVQGLGVLTSPLKAKFVNVFENFMVLSFLSENATVEPQKIRWCQFGDFTKWENETDGTGQSGAATFDGPDWIMGVKKLKRELFFYRERQIEAMSYIGPPDVFAFRTAETKTGLLARNAIVDLGDVHIFVGHDNVWENNGVSVNPIGDAIRKDFFDQLTPDNRETVNLFYLEEEDEVWLSFSTTSDRVQDKAYVYNLKLRAWSGPRTVNATAYGKHVIQDDVVWDSAVGAWDSSTDAWDSRAAQANAPIPLMGNDEGQVFQLEQGSTANGVTLASRYESVLTDCGQRQMMKRLQRVRVDFEEFGSELADVYVGVAQSAGDSLTWHGPYTLGMNTDQEPYVFVDLSGRFFKVRVDIETTAKIKHIELHYFNRQWR